MRFFVSCFEEWLLLLVWFIFMSLFALTVFWKNWEWIRCAICSLSFWLLGFDLISSLYNNQTCLCINNYRKSGKKDFSTTILEWKKSVNRLVVDEAINDDNSVVAMHPVTMEKLQFFHGDTMLIKPKKPKKMQIGFSGFLNKKPNQNWSVWAGFGSFFLVWLYCFGKNGTEPKIIISTFTGYAVTF